MILTLFSAKLPLQARQIIDSIQDPTESFYCKLSYLTAGRVNELCGVGVEESQTVDRKDHLTKQIERVTIPNTRPVGPTRESISFDSYEGSEVLLIQIQIEKRHQAKGVPIRTVALPINEFEPWAKEITKEVEKLGVNDPLIPTYRKRLSGVWKKHNFDAMALSLPENVGYKHVKNPLRHFRINDLISYYKFAIAEELPIYTGHKASSIAKVSSALERYLHLRWTDYFPKLLKPLP